MTTASVTIEITTEHPLTDDEAVTLVERAAAAVRSVV